MGADEISNKTFLKGKGGQRQEAGCNPAPAICSRSAGSVGQGMTSTLSIKVTWKLQLKFGHQVAFASARTSFLLLETDQGRNMEQEGQNLTCSSITLRLICSLVLVSVVKVQSQSLTVSLHSNATFQLIFPFFSSKHKKVIYIGGSCLRFIKSYQQIMEYF